MAFGDGPDDARLRDAWLDFCRKLAVSGDAVFKDENPVGDLYRVDALRFLTQNLGQAFDLALETRDTRYPQLHPFCSPTRKLGSDCADFIYQQAWIDGHSEYCVRGNVGSARFLNFTVQGSLTEDEAASYLHEPFCDKPEANLFGHELETTEGGDFSLHLGGEPRAKNWLPLTPATRKLFIRQAFDSWDEVPASLTIERVDMASPKPLPNADRMIEAVHWAGDFLQGIMADWPDYPFTRSPFVDPLQANVFPDGPAVAGADDQRRGRAVAHMCWRIDADEALIVAFDAHDGFWSLTNMGAFFNSMDFRYRPVSYTPSRTRVDSDGVIRLVLAHQDPGVHNWIDTQGFERGHLTYRNLLGLHPTRFSTRLLKCEELFEALPAATARVTPAEREAQLWRRFRAIQRRFAGII